ncbi:MAG: class I SAM-dependent methyltransferase [Spirochaetes bacterium]|nr:class I SAM-dependent methyltransferase [Spirochaetota bacterium]
MSGKENKTIKPYEKMADHYDYLLRHVDYTEWYEYIKKIAHVYCASPEYILEIGTGTGKFGAKFAADSIPVYGMDISHEMLLKASKRAFGNYRIFQGDIRKFYLKKKFDFIFCVHDTINYLTSKKDVIKALRNVKDIMHENSVFLFDITTEYNIYRYFNNKASQYTNKHNDITWINTYNKRKRLITSTLSFNDKAGEVFTENHIQKIYHPDEMKKFIKKAGLEIIDIFSDYTYEMYDDTTIMINFLVRKKK